MATTTPNFGWPVPTSTDLVKDGATAIEALGDGIDTSMVDLKGGLTGQVLAKTTNADMDFTWVTTDDTNAIQNSIVDAKGDLIAASAADTPARLAVGANDTMLVGDSTAATGLSYKSAATLYPWTTWTPTYGNFTVGNATVTARYQQIGKLVNVYFKLVWGSTTSFTSFPTFSLPVNAANTAYTAGNTYIQDTGTGSFAGAVYFDSATAFQLTIFGTSGTYASNAFLSANTVPFTWTNTDQMIASFSYEAA
jgi:hypothetical protein